MNATFSRQLAQLVQEPPADLDPMTQIHIREQLVAATDRGADQFTDLPEDLQEQLRQWPRFVQIFKQSSAQEDGVTHSRSLPTDKPQPTEERDCAPLDEAADQQNL